MKPKSRSFVHFLVRGGHKRKRLLLFAIAFVILSIVAISYFCPENICRQEKTSNILSSASLPWISSFLPYSSDSANSLSYSSSSQQSESDDVDHILGRTFGFSFDRYQYFQLAKTWQVTFGEILASPKKSSFHIKGNDVMVFLHMQKTGNVMFVLIFANFIFKICSTQGDLHLIVTWCAI